MADFPVTGDTDYDISPLDAADAPDDGDGEFARSLFDPAGDASGMVPYRGDFLWLPRREGQWWVRDAWAGGEGAPPPPDLDALPAGPYRISMVWDFGSESYCRPYTIVGSGTGVIGNSVIGEIGSFARAVAVRDALNAMFAGGRSVMTQESGLCRDVATHAPPCRQVATSTDAGGDQMTEPAEPDRIDRRSVGTTITYRGRTLLVSEWAAIRGIPLATLRRRIDRGWSDIAALLSAPRP